MALIGQILKFENILANHRARGYVEPLNEHASFEPSSFFFEQWKYG
jgi:hypothetical protein